MLWEFEYKGEWWLPAKPENKITGTLRFSPNKGAVLELLGSFKDIRAMARNQEEEIILGFSTNGKNITLHNCFETQSTLSLPGFLTSSFYASFVVVGIHFQKQEDIKFKELSVHYSHLDEWVNISGFDFQYNEGKIIVEYETPKSIEAKVGDGLKVIIDFQTSYPTRSIVQKEASIKQTTFIRIEPSEEKSLDEYLEIMYHIQNFLSLGIMEPIYPLAVKGTTETNKSMINDKVHYPTVEIFFKLLDTLKTNQNIVPFDMLFTFRDISDKFESFLRNWFQKIDQLEPVFHLYFGTLYNPRMYLQHQFLSLVHAIESYHRRVMKNYELPIDEHKMRIEEILNSVPKKYKEWLKGKLSYSDEPSLRKRLIEIFDRHSEIGNSFIGDKDAFIQQVVVTRNYLTHYDSRLKEQSAKGEELYEVTQMLRIILETCLLTELGFNFDEIKNLFSRNRRYKMEIKKPEKS